MLEAQLVSAVYRSGKRDTIMYHNDNGDNVPDQNLSPHTMRKSYHDGYCQVDNSGHPNPSIISSSSSRSNINILLGIGNTGVKE